MLVGSSVDAQLVSCSDPLRMILQSHWSYHILGIYAQEICLCSMLDVQCGHSVALLSIAVFLCHSKLRVRNHNLDDSKVLSAICLQPNIFIRALCMQPDEH